MGIRNALSKIARIRFYISFLLVGVLFVGAACFALSLPKVERVSVEGTIQSIESDMNDEYTVLVSYTDKNGIIHRNIVYPEYSSSLKEGETVTVLYNPDSPEDITSPGTKYIPYVFIVIGSVAIAVSVYSIVTGLKKNQSDSPFENDARKPDPFLVEQIKNDDSPIQNYYFHWTGKLNQSYVLETHDREAVYEAICDHIGVFTPYRFTFVNRKTGKIREHKISHTHTKRYGNGSDSGFSLSFVSDSEFKIDDISNWKYLADMGYSIEPMQCGLKLNFDVLHYGVPVACLEAAGANILDDDKQSFLGDKLTTNGLFKVSCKDSDLEGVFIACFCVSRVEFY